MTCFVIRTIDSAQESTALERAHLKVMTTYPLFFIPGVEDSHQNTGKLTPEEKARQCGSPFGLPGTHF